MGENEGRSQEANENVPSKGLWILSRGAHRVLRPQGAKLRGLQTPATERAARLAGSRAQRPDTTKICMACSQRAAIAKGA